MNCAILGASFAGSLFLCSFAGSLIFVLLLLVCGLSSIFFIIFTASCSEIHAGGWRG